MNLQAFIRWTVCPSVLDPEGRGCEGVMGKLQTHWRCLYELSTMKRRATACFFPRWIKKSSSLSVSLRRIISPKSEQINHLEKNEGGFACMFGAPFYGCVTRPVCMSAFVSVHPCFVCRRVTASMFVHVSVCMTVNMRVNRRHEEADGYFSIGGVWPEEAWLRRWIRLPVQTS